MTMVIAGIIYLLFSFPPSLAVSGIFRAPIETIPFDAGWIGLLLTLLNGALLSYVIIKERVDSTERLVLSIGLGFGSSATIMILIGILGNFSLTTIILSQMSFFAILFAAAVHQTRKIGFKGFHMTDKSTLLRKHCILPSILLIIIGIFVIAALYKAVSLPAIEWDSLAYGVNYARIIFEEGGIPLIAGPSVGLEMSASYPPGVQLIAVYLYKLAGSPNDFYYRLLSPIFGLALMLATYRFTIGKSKSKTVSIFAVFTLSAIPIFWELFVQETYLLGLALMLTLSAFCYFKAYNLDSGNARGYEIAGTLFCCFSALMSYMGLFSFGLLLLYGLHRRISVKRFSFLIILALLVTLPWYTRNFVLLGNPIYPFFDFGKHLDSLLRNSAVQHFQNYNTIPIYAWTSTICKIGAVCLGLAIAALTFGKKRKFILILPTYLRSFLLIIPAYLLFASLIIMALHLSFPRYLIIAISSLIVIFSATLKPLLTKHSLTRVIAISLVLMIALSNAYMLPFINNAKPAKELAKDKWTYISQVFEEGDAWIWINEETPEDDRIATYDIKQYYLKRDIMPLDGNESAPLYELNTVEESINFLQDKKIGYILSPPWASPTDPRMPLAYTMFRSNLTRYLGDPDYFPIVFVGVKGTAVYHVGQTEKDPYEFFTENNMALPLKHISTNLTLISNTNPPVCRLYLPIPVDYRNLTMIASIYNLRHPINVELWRGIIPDEMIGSPQKELELAGFELLRKNSTKSDSNSFAQDLLMTWEPVDKSGYFTIRAEILGREELHENYNFAIDLRFYD